MADNAQPSTVTTVVTTPAAPTSAAPRPWMQMVMMIAALVTIALTINAQLQAIGAWRSSVDLQLADLKSRMGRAEENQRTYIPVLLGLTKDVSYLADRARREDDRLERERRVH